MTGTNHDTGDVGNHGGGDHGGVDRDVVTVDGFAYRRVDRLTPREARNDLADDVLAALADAGVRGFVVKPIIEPGMHRGIRIGVPPGGRHDALRALARLAGPAVHYQERYPRALAPQAVRPLTPESMSALPSHCGSLLLARFWSVAGGSLLYGLEYAVGIEFWTVSETDPHVVLASRRNAAAVETSDDLLADATITVDGRSRPSIALFDRAMLGEATFEVDAVYTWVDGDDPAWRERMLRARADSEGVEYHPESLAVNRFLSRDELRYSLRSLAMYAPWIRRIFLVTDQQVPAWLDPDDDRITVVDHRDIYTDPSVLPVFNSSAIITQLHHIEGLAEHYLYLNDDIFLGRDVRPENFWFGNGITKMFPSRLTRPFGAAHSEDAPHFNISKNIRTVLERDLDVSISNSIRHTPYPQVRSVNYELEERFAAELRATAGHRFRHHTDIAQDQLFHYYAQATARAVPVPRTEFTYEYVNVGVARSVHRLRRILRGRDIDTICLNDAPEPGEEPLDDTVVAEFLADYYPLAAPWERADG
ncbi:Stealth protein CR4, conserved region 4 [Jatrophihabitans endophyticus]|uniref:Stealth protein CR4, conserved region 4 n=1 Tax=Jatrophihabitans endophyticus TaxID=1206085 RepID=A0A1M5I345_9ACTN|nr:stealth family protein [Jatrophihabitans endophyticus]SHG22622.1 Stealth protein CR4, conserved region 4 [Jatrophihabitans endophyticus]